MAYAKTSERREKRLLREQMRSMGPYKGSAAARTIFEDVAGYLGGDPVPMPHPLAIGPGSVR